MSSFEYLVGIHTIVLGLAMAQLLTTIADTIRFRDTLEGYWLHTAWCVLMVLLVLGWWYGLWRLLGDEGEILYRRFLPSFGFTVSLFLAARFLTLDLESHRTASLEEHFARVRVPFFAFLGLPKPRPALISSKYLRRNLETSSQYSLRHDPGILSR